MIRLLLTRRWLAWILVAVVWGIGCFFLGRWQWHRWESKHGAQQQVSQNYNAPPRSLTSIVPTRTSQLPANRQWAQVRLTGHYLPAARILVRNRPDNGNFGYEVLVPFVQDGGAGTVLVDRGWVDNGANASTPAYVPPAPSGTSTVLGWLRPTEDSLGRAPVKGSVASINPGDVTAQTRVATYTHVFVRMRSERTATGAVPARPAPLDKPDPGSYAGINLSYALQWWLGMVAGLAFVLFRARQEHRDAELESGATPPKPPRVKKVRIWDEEDA
ncbi:SURF1 family protein [Allobranchiibius sp. GilTou73]|uniref:SURF1 family cytochrome oxidase biogenesis protein n=1 Tax=Allobranchiibius sp. GilTou73 TaxID=2904523 RepID=UPI001F2DE570|nr:SURF1 family protein [Allobranchiibius sp. GilTou73]UIJ33890.1 SURF1 family protein [Allobranchiibius sp. GilTou73]